LRKLLIAALAFFLSGITFAQNVPPEAGRLLATGKLWVTVKYFHPYLAYHDIDWDKALVDALPRVRSASTPDEYAAAIQSMLDVLKDPATHTGAATAEPKTSAQRVWIHNGLIHPAFLIKAGAETEAKGLEATAGFAAGAALS